MREVKEDKKEVICGILLIIGINGITQIIDRMIKILEITEI